MSVEKLSARLIKKNQLTRSFWWFEFQFAKEFGFKAGQYLSVKVNEEGDRRAYSIASVPGGKKIGLLVDVSPGGVGSKFFESLQVGEEVEVLGPLGRFVVERLGSTSERSHRSETVSDEKPFVVFVATGSGIAPIKAMVGNELQKKTGSTSEQSPKTTVSDEKPFDIVLVWGMRYERDLFWVKMFKSWERKYKNFKFELVLSKPSGGWQGKKGHVTDVLMEMKNLIGTEFYLCGSNQMVEDCQKVLTDKGVDQNKIHFEKYG